MPVDKLTRSNVANARDFTSDWLNAITHALTGNKTLADTGRATFKPLDLSAKPIALSAIEPDWRSQAEAALDNSPSTRDAIIELQNPNFEWGDGEQLSPWVGFFSDLSGAEKERAVREANRPTAAVEHLWLKFDANDHFDAFSFSPDGLIFYKDGNIVDGPELSDEDRVIFKWLANNEGLVTELAGNDGILMKSEIKPWLDARKASIEKATDEFRTWLDQNPSASRQQRADKRLELIAQVSPSLVPVDVVGPGLNPEAPDPVHPAVEAYLAKHPDADPMSRDTVKNSGAILVNWDQISGGKGEITADDVKAYLEAHPELSQETKDALTFWTHPGMWRQLDVGGDNPALGKADGIVSRQNIERWIEMQAPTNPRQYMGMLNEAALQTARSKADISALGPDVFINPDNYTHEQRAAVLNELLNARTSILAGIQSGLWSDSKSQVWVAANANINPNSDKVLADLNDKIGKILNSTGMQDYLRGAIETELKTIVDADPSIKAALQQYYDEKIKNGSAFDELLNLKDSAGNNISIPASLDLFIYDAETVSAALGLEAPDLTAILSASGHMPQLEQYFRDRVVSGADLNDMLEKGIDPTIAFAAFGEEIARFRTILDPAVFESLQGDLEKNFGTISYNAMMDQVTFEDLRAAYGNADGTLNEDLLREILTQMSEQNPELFVGPNGPLTIDQTLGGMRSVWDEMRQGAKAADAFAKLDFLVKPGNSIQGAYSAGSLHLFSGWVMGGVAIGRGVKFNNGARSPADIVSIVTGSTITAGVLLEGGAKGYNDWLGTVGERFHSTGKMTDPQFAEWKAARSGWSAKVEAGGKLIGGPSGMVAGVFGIISGATDLKKGNTVIGGINITGGGLSILAGGATTAEGLMTYLGISGRVLFGVAGFAGTIGLAASVLGAGLLIGLFIYQEVRTEQNLTKFSDTTESYLDQWGIDGGQTLDSDYTLVSESQVS